MKDVVTAILGGGQGARLWPLTKSRAKPAVPIGGKFRLIDIPISNSLHAGIQRIYVLTQFNTASLHRHIAQTFRFDTFSHGYVNILAAEQSLDNRDWYQGTADAVRQNLHYFADADPSEVLILSGDQLYLMDIVKFVHTHRMRKADVTIAVKPVPKAEASGLGVMRVDATGQIVEFVEKPTDPAVMDSLVIGEEAVATLGVPVSPDSVLASMGIYIFKPDVLTSLLTETDGVDFGREIIPGSIERSRVFSFVHNGYWRDIGTIPSFHLANLELTRPVPELNLYSPDFPIYTHPRFLPGCKIDRCTVRHAILGDGSIISRSTINDSIIGVRAVVGADTVIENSVVMGATRFGDPSRLGGRVPIGIGRGTHIRNAILDLNARIGPGCRLTNEAGIDELRTESYCIRGGIIVVPRGAEIEAGTVI